jgi:hypothetical protein
LDGSEEAGDRPISWRASNFAPLLLKRTFQIALLMGDTRLCGTLLALADSVWEHLLQRRLKDGPGQDLWDQPGDAFEQLSSRNEISSPLGDIVNPVTCDDANFDGFVVPFRLLSTHHELQSWYYTLGSNGRSDRQLF